jgi:hypothetical protein
MKIAVDISGALEAQLTQTAERLNVPPADLAAAAVRDFVARPAADFDAAARRVLEKNRELYERLR